MPFSAARAMLDASIAQVDNKEARMLNVSYHICEVQLIPQQIMDLRKDNGHARYIAYRNSRCE